MFISCLISLLPMDSFFFFFFFFFSKSRKEDVVVTKHVDGALKARERGYLRLLSCSIVIKYHNIHLLSLNIIQCNTSQSKENIY